MPLKWVEMGEFQVRKKHYAASTRQIGSIGDISSDLDSTVRETHRLHTSALGRDSKGRFSLLGSAAVTMPAIRTFFLLDFAGRNDFQIQTETIALLNADAFTPRGEPAHELGVRERYGLDRRPREEAVLSRHDTDQGEAPAPTRQGPL